MPNLPVPTQTDAVIQNTTTGQVDYLKFEGNTLVASNLKEYGLGSSFTVVANGDFNADGQPDLLAQNPSTGVIDFVYLDANANIIGSHLTNINLPRIVGEGSFSTTVPGQAGPTVVSQLPNGQLDMLAFNTAGNLISSDLIPNSVGLPRAVGVGESFAFFPVIANVGSVANDSVVTQLPDGSIDVIGFSGDFLAKNLSFSASFLLPGSAGTPPVFGVNPDFSIFGGTNARNLNVLGPPGLVPGTNLEGLQLLTKTAAAAIDVVYFDSGYRDPSNKGVMYASNLTSPSFPGWQGVDANIVAHTSLFPVT
jgi:hypothetical protein